MIRVILTLLIASFGLGLNSQDNSIIPGELLVQLEEGAILNVPSLSRDNIGLPTPKVINGPLNIYHIHFDKNLSYDAVVRELKQGNKVLAVMPNMVSEKRNIPNDEHYDKQEDLRRIDIERAWSVTTGGTTANGDRIVVAILDSGYGVDLIDIKENHYQNKDESPGDANGDGCPGDCGVDDDMDGRIDEDAFDRLPTHPLYNPNAALDDDENGYNDDIWGLNMLNLSDQHPSDKHGTAVAGIIGAAGNNKESVTGINWDVEMMLISEVVNIGQIVEAYTYIYNQRRLYNESGGEKGAYVVVTNFSSGIDKRFGHEFPIWCDLYDLLGSVGVLSVGATTNSTRNVDEEGDLPTTCESPYLISVTNLDLEDRLGSAGYGPIHIDLGAPGQGSITTSLTNPDNVGDFSGTSAATPHVAGAIALLHSIPCEAFATYYKENPEKVVEIKDYVLSSVDPASDLVGKAVSEGRLNVYSTMVALRDFCPGSEAGDVDFINTYPNPSYRETITIEYAGPDGEGEYELSVFDFNGELVHTESFTPPLYGDKTYEFEPPFLSAGVYYIVLRNNKELVSRRHVFIPY